MPNLSIVTGAAGHLGSAVVHALKQQGCRVRALVLPGDPAAVRLPSGIEQVAGNVLDPRSLSPLFETTEDCELTVYHCAGIVSTSLKNNSLLHAVNVEGTRNLLHLCCERNVRKLVHVSSVHALSELPEGVCVAETEQFDPDDVMGPYAKSKAEATRLVLEAANTGLDASVVFPSGICGPGDSGIGYMTRLLVLFAGKKMPLGVQGGFDFVDVRDVANGILQCADKGGKGEGYILSNRFVPIRELFALFSLFTGVRPVHLFAPVWLAQLGLPFFSLAEKMSKKPALFNRYALHTLSGETRYSCDKAVRDLGYKVRPFQETVCDTVQWLRGEGRIASFPG